ncbi:unnamed protein product [Choristocarpus tenellus]
MAMLGAFKDMFEDGDDGMDSGGGQSKGEERLSRAESGFVGLDNQGATCYLNALLQAMYMTPELRHGLYAVDPRELGGDWYEQEGAKEKEKAKTRVVKERARLKKQEAEGRVEPDKEVMQQLKAMGFSLQGSRRAALTTKNSGLDAALDWAMAHSEDKDFNTAMPGYDDDEDGGCDRLDGR